MGRAPCCDKANVKKGPWSPEEDAKLKDYIEQHGTGGNWIALPQKIGLKRCGKSCRLRWLNYLRPNIKHGGFSEEEDNIICSLYVSIGSRWSIIAAQLPGRTDNDIKNYWNTRLKKKLLGKQRKEQALRVSSSLKHHQEMKREPQLQDKLVVTMVPSSSSSSSGGRGVITQSTPYWPAADQHCVAAAMPVLMPNNASNIILDYDHHHHHHHHPSNQTSSSSLRSLLNELGAIRFPHDHHHQQQQPYASTAISCHDDTREISISFPQDQVYDPIPTTMINTVTMVSDDANGGTSHQPSNNIFQGYENFPSDLSHLVCVNPQQIEGSSIQGFYGMESMDMASGSTNTTSTESTSWGDMSSLVYSPLVSDYEGCPQGIIPQDAAFEDSRYFGMQMQ